MKKALCPTFSLSLLDHLSPPKITMTPVNFIIVISLKLNLVKEIRKRFWLRP